MLHFPKYFQIQDTSKESKGVIMKRRVKNNMISTAQLLFMGKSSHIVDDCVKFKDISRTSKSLSYCFQGLKT